MQILMFQEVAAHFVNSLYEDEQKEEYIISIITTRTCINNRPVIISVDRELFFPG